MANVNVIDQITKKREGWVEKVPSGDLAYHSTDALRLFAELGLAQYGNWLEAETTDLLRSEERSELLKGLYLLRKTERESLFEAARERVRELRKLGRWLEAEKRERRLEQKFDRLKATSGPQGRHGAAKKRAKRQAAQLKNKGKVKPAKPKFDAQSIPLGKPNPQGIGQTERGRVVAGAGLARAKKAQKK